MTLAEPLCADCNPQRGRVGEVVTSQWRCPEHQAKYDELMAEIGPHLRYRTCQPCRFGACAHCDPPCGCDHGGGAGSVKSDPAPIAAMGENEPDPVWPDSDNHVG